MIGQTAEARRGARVEIPCGDERTSLAPVVRSRWHPTRRVGGTRPRRTGARPGADRPHTETLVRPCRRDAGALLPVTRSAPFRIRRIYDAPEDGEAYRVLVDRLWPRGVKKSEAALDEWAKDVAPSTALRRWYGHDPDRFDEFTRRYRTELAEAPADATVTRLLRHSRQTPVILVTATRDTDHSGARVLLDYLVGRRRAR
jgi:uncharacterized protein YeaO (DUF488 family)